MYLMACIQITIYKMFCNTVVLQQLIDLWFASKFGTTLYGLSICIQEEKNYYIFITEYQWVSWVIKCNGLFRASSHTSPVIITYTLEKLSSLTENKHSPEVELKCKKKWKKKKHKKVRAPIKFTCHWRWQLFITLQFTTHLTNFLDWNRVTYGNINLARRK